MSKDDDVCLRRTPLELSKLSICECYRKRMSLNKKKTQKVAMTVLVVMSL